MYIFIVNPAAGSGRSEKVFDRLQHDTSFQRLYKRIFVSSYQGHIEMIMHEVNECCKTDDVRTIFVIGGDGTMHEVLNHLGHPHIPVGFIPGGSGNDFARNFQQSRHIRQYTRGLGLIEGQKTNTFWPGSFEMEKQDDRMFLNCLGFGFDAVVAQAANQSRWKKCWNRLKLGKLVYLFALVQSLFSYKPISLTVTIDGTVYKYPRCLFLTVNNQPYFGGGMKINPKANNNPKTFGIVVVDSISKWKVLALFLTVFFGKHLSFKEVQLFKGQSISVASNDYIPYQSDGETGQTKQAVIQKYSHSFLVQSRSNHSLQRDIPLPK